MPFGISLPELLILLVVLLLVFGARRLPEMGKSLGKGMREFKDAVSGAEETTPTPTTPPELPSASAATPEKLEPRPTDPAKVRADLESLSDEDRRAIMDSVASPPSETASAPESEREPVS